MEEYFEVKVHGEYFAQSGKERVVRGYKAVFKLPNADAPLSVIKGKLLKPFLEKRDPGFLDIYTHHIDEINPKGRKFDPDEIPYRFQTKDQLKEYCRRHRLPVKVDEYGSLGLLRDHVRLAKEEPENFRAVYDKYNTKRIEEKALYALNEEVFETGEVGLPISMKEGGDTKKPVLSVEEVLE